MSFNRFSRFKWQIFNFQDTQRLAVTWPCKGQLDFLLCFFQLPFLILSDDFQSAIVKLDDLVKDFLLYYLLCSFLYCVTIIHHIVRDVNTLFCIYYIKLLWTILCKSHKNVIDIWAICTKNQHKHNVPKNIFLLLLAQCVSQYLQCMQSPSHFFRWFRAASSLLRVDIVIIKYLHFFCLFLFLFLCCLFSFILHLTFYFFYVILKNMVD